MASALHQLKIFIFWRAIVANSRLTGFIGFLLLASCAFVIPSNLRAQGEGSLLVMPVPAHVVQREGEFLIDGPFGIALKGYKEARLERAQQRFLDTLSRETGIPQKCIQEALLCSFKTSFLKIGEHTSELQSRG